MTFIPKWEVTIVDQDSEDVEKELITEYEARVSAATSEEAKERAVAMIRERVKGVGKLVVTNVREIWKPGRPPGRSRRS